MLSETLSMLNTEPTFDKFNSSPTAPYCTIKRHPLVQIIFQALSSIIINKLSASKFKTFLLDIFKNNNDALVTIVELVTLTFGNLRAVGDTSNANINQYYKFWW